MKKEHKKLLKAMAEMVATHKPVKIGKKWLAVFDFETDPFLFGRRPEPFSAGFYDGEIYKQFWGDDCVEKLIQFLNICEKDYIVYAHNGGKFDFFYLMESGDIENPIKIINSRIVSAKFGEHELRDSYSILPIPLAAYQKYEIDYDKFERKKREKHKEEILDYLKSDCVFLFDLVAAFINRFGLNLTIGSTAIKEVEKIVPFDRIDSEAHYNRFRPYYFGGRVEAFKKGILKPKKKRKWRVFDVNSMYPYVMSEYLHPCGVGYTHDIDDIEKLPPGYPYFIEVFGYAHGCFPVRGKYSLSYPTGYGTFKLTSHEYEEAKRLGLFEVVEIIDVSIPKKVINFSEYVKIYSKEKEAAKECGDKAAELFAKLMQNTPYGKFAQSTETYKDYKIWRHIKRVPKWENQRPNQAEPDCGWEMAVNAGEWELWERPTQVQGFYDLAIAASITGAARAVLMRAIAMSKNVVYCDTDSVICEEFGGGEQHKTRLGCWDNEASGDTVAIAGKKIYCLIDKWEKVKLACKGAKLDMYDIFEMSNGSEVTWNNKAPTFKIGGGHNFISRTLRMT